jgi:DNA-binding HxlR family transcriptional regulator
MVRSGNIQPPPIDQASNIMTSTTTTTARATDRGYRVGIECPVELTMDVVGGKWKGAILFHLLDGPTRFGALRRLLPRVTQRMLTLQLRELETDGLIHRNVFGEVPPRVEYSLTDFGHSLEPVIMAMQAWGTTYRQQVLDRRPGHAALLDSE